MSKFRKLGISIFKFRILLLQKSQSQPWTAVQKAVLLWNSLEFEILVSKIEFYVAVSEFHVKDIWCWMLFVQCCSNKWQCVEIFYVNWNTKIEMNEVARVIISYSNYLQDRSLFSTDIWHRPLCRCRWRMHFLGVFKFTSFTSYLLVKVQRMLEQRSLIQGLSTFWLCLLNLILKL